MHELQEAIDFIAAFGILGESLVVVEDEAPTQIGSIHLPEVAQKLAHSGTIVGCGPDAPMWGTVAGRKVYYRNYAGVRVRLQGRPFLLLAPDEVVCFRFPEGESLYAPTDYLLVEREELPERTAGNALFVPHGIRRHTLAATAIVVDDTGYRGDRIRKGDRVLLATNAGREVEVGERTVLRVSPERILLVIPPGEAENEGKSALAGLNPADFDAPKAVAEEGTPEALR